jgi:hypothetical protein
MTRARNWWAGLPGYRKVSFILLIPIWATWFAALWVLVTR